MKGELEKFATDMIDRCTLGKQSCAAIPGRRCRVRATINQVSPLSALRYKSASMSPPLTIVLLCYPHPSLFTRIVPPLVALLVVHYWMKRSASTLAPLIFREDPSARHRVSM